MDVRLNLRVLDNVKSIVSGEIKEDYFGLDFEQYAKLLLSIQREGLIKGVSHMNADDSIYYLHTDDISLTLQGVEYLKNINEEVQKNILEILYENRFDMSLTSGQIRHKIFIHLRNPEIDAHLNLLKDKRYLIEETEKIPGVKGKFSSPASTQKRFRISPQGIAFVESGFKPIEKAIAPRTVFNINGGVVNFGVIHSLTINYPEELKTLIPESSIREEIEKYFEEIKEITSEKNIDKGKLTKVIKNMADKAVEKGLDKVLDKLLDVGWLYALNHIMH